MSSRQPTGSNPWRFFWGLFLGRWGHPPRSTSKGVQAYFASQTSPSTLGSVFAQARLHRNRFPRHSLIQLWFLRKTAGFGSRLGMVVLLAYFWCSLWCFCKVTIHVWACPFMCYWKKSLSIHGTSLNYKAIYPDKIPKLMISSEPQISPPWTHHSIFAICWGCHSLWGVSGTAMSNRGIESWMEVYRNHPHPRAPLFC